MEVTVPVRGLLVSLVPDLASFLAGLPQETVEALPETAPAVAVANVRFEIVEFEVDTRTEMIEVTAFGDAYRRFEPGVRSASIRFRCYATDEAFETLNRAMRNGEPVTIDQDMQGYRVVATIVPTLLALAGGRTLKVDALVVGDALVQKLAEQVPDLPAGIRGIRL